MAEVWAAEHTVMRREAAVKLLLPEMSRNKTIVKRFFREAQAIAQVRHPGIVEVFDVGYAPDGRAYIVMERLYGEPFSVRLHREGKLSVDTAVVFIRQLAGVMAVAHERGIVHRDLKPENMFVVTDPEVPGGERIKVLDFGLAKLAVGAGSLQTAEGAVFGTPSYMAPEQCRDAKTVDHRADLYAIGCIFYRCLTGRPPFQSEGLSVLAHHMNTPPVPVRELVPAVPIEIDALILHLLAKRPSDRLSSCTTLIRALGSERDAVPRPIPHPHDDGSTLSPRRLANPEQSTLEEVDTTGNEAPTLPRAPRALARDHAPVALDALGASNTGTIPDAAALIPEPTIPNATDQPLERPSDNVATLLVNSGRAHSTGHWWLLVAVALILIAAVGAAFLT